MAKTRFVALKFAVYAAVALLLTVVQNTPGLLLIGSAKPMLTAAFAIAVAMFEGELAGAFAGAFGGFLCDLFSYYRFGYYALMLFICCLMVGLLVQGYMRPVVAFFFLFLIRGYEGTNILFLSRMLPLCIYTAAAAVPAFLAVRWLHQRFQRLIYPAE